MFRKTLVSVLAGALLLTGCTEDDRKVRIGAKNFGESRILAHMMAAVVEEQGIPVAGVVDYENTEAILEALKRGNIDAYPEYNGTGLVMLGQSPLTDGDEATAQVKKVFEPLGISWRDRVGFANNYGLVMLPERAEELGISTMSDLASVSSQTTIGIDSDFRDRPLDGFTPMNQLYGFDFASVVEVEQSDRGNLYDHVLNGSADVIEIYTTDGQIADYGLTLIEDDQSFFPIYELAPIVRIESLAEFAGLGAALDTLGGVLDEQTMQELNHKVDLEGRSEAVVARDTLARLGVISSGAVEAAEPLKIAASPILADSRLSTTALRAVRRAYTGREVVVSTASRPLDEVASGSARIAMVGAESFFDLSGPNPVRREQFESLAVVGSNIVHLVAAGSGGGAAALQDASELVVEGEGSASHRIATILKDGLGLSADITSVDASSTAELLGNVDGSKVAVVAAVAGDTGITGAFNQGNLKLLAVEGWEDGSNFVKYPFLRKARVPADTYDQQFVPVDTLSSQVVLAGPAPGSAQAAIGEQGPGATAAPSLKPVPSSTVSAMAASVTGGDLFDPVLRIASTFAPSLPEPPAPMNPSADVSILNVLLTLMFAWMAWLYIRREHR